jgi:hypothetical protein
MKPPNRSIIYRVSRSGHVMGEYDIDRIVELLDSGEFLWTDLCWAQGMAGWAPLSNLSAEVAAAKAFPPVAAMPMPLASGRRRMQAPSSQMTTPQATTPSVAGWMWIVGGVTLGALVGLLTTQLFPNTVLVDRPVEKVVDRPVEVIRTVERRVDIPAVLTPEQKAAEVFYRRFYDYKEHKKGLRLFNVSSRVKVMSYFSGDGMYALSEGLIRTKVESAFRAQGFKVLSEDSTEYPFNTIDVYGTVLDSGVSKGVSVAGSYGLEISQSITYLNNFETSLPSDVVIKSGNVELYRKSGAYFFGSQRFGDIVSAYERIAQEAAGELRKVNDN